MQPFRRRLRYRPGVRNVLFFIVLSGCTPALQVGAPCTFDSNCPEATVCTLGRCRGMCLTARDCGGRPCLLTGGLGRCQEETDTCTTVRDCPTDLMCAGGYCTTGCATDAECPGAACVEGTCRRSEVDAGPPIDTGIADAGTPDAGELVTCGDTRDCASGQVCTGTLCLAMCTSTAECPRGSHCVMTPDAGTVCSPVCNPSTGESCPSGYTCRVADTSQTTEGSAVVTFCQVPATGTAGCPCSGSVAPDLCGENLSCLEGATSQCAEICELGTTCADGSNCGAADGPRYMLGGVTYSLCAAPAEPAGCP